MSSYTYVKGAQEVQAQLLAYPAKVEAKVVRASLAAGARVIRDIARAEVPRRKGLLAGSIRVKSRVKNGQATAGVRVGNLKTGVFYAHMVLGGTRAHRITVRKAKSLRLGGLTANVVTRKSVQHPGAKANNFMDRSKAAIPRALDTIIARAEALAEKLNREVESGP